MELVDLGEIFARAVSRFSATRSDAGGVVKAINAKGFAGITIGQADELTEIAKLYGAKGTRLHQDRERRMEIAHCEIFLRS